MFEWHLYLKALYSMLAFGLLGWLYSVARKNVTIVDSMWSLFFLLSACTYFYLNPTPNTRAHLIITMVAIWATRLCIHLSWRNRGNHEDHRYQAIRSNNEPHFWLKSLYIVFVLQVILAWIVGLPLLGAMNSDSALNLLDYLGVAIWLLGLIWETTGDLQLAKFKANPANKGLVLNTGLWKLSRHPNYFGECCIWWGYFLIALAAGAWWSILGPALMTLLLVKVSGVSLLEKDICQRRPDYANYIENTNALVPWLPKQ